MSELLVVDYHDAQRAGEVLEALRQGHPEWRADLEDSVVFIQYAHEKTLSAERWTQHMGMSDDFIAQVRKLVRPGDSTLVLRIKIADADQIIDEVQRFGGRVLQASFTPQQDEQFQSESETEASWA